MHLCFSINYSFFSHRHKYNLFNPWKKKIRHIQRNTNTHWIHLWPKTPFDVKWWNLLSTDWLASLWRHRKEVELYQLTHSFTMFTLRSASLIAGLIHSLLHSHILYTSTLGHILSLSAIHIYLLRKYQLMDEIKFFLFAFFKMKTVLGRTTKNPANFFFSVSEYEVRSFVPSVLTNDVFWKISEWKTLK